MIKKLITRCKEYSAFCPAVGAGTEKIDPVTVDGEIGRTADFFVNFGEKAFFEVGYGAAFTADQVVVGIGFRFEPVECAAGIDFAHQTLLDQYGEVPVDRTGAEVRKLRFQPVIEPCGGGMA